MIPLIILAIEDSNDRDFMENLFLSYRRLMFSEIHKITDDRWATEDILQSVIIKLIDKIDFLRSLDRSKLVNYIIAASRNTAYNYHRSKKRIVEFPYDDEFDNPAYQSPQLEDGFLMNELMEGVHAAWQTLDETSRRVLELKYTLEKSNTEIASELGIQPDSVRMALTRARKKLKDQLKETEMI